MKIQIVKDEYEQKIIRLIHQIDRLAELNEKISEEIDDD